MNAKPDNLVIGHVTKVPDPPVLEVKTSQEERTRIAYTGNHQEKVDLAAEIKKAKAAYEDKLAAWTKKCEPLTKKDAWMKFESAKITVAVKSNKLELDSGKFKALKALVVT